MFLFRIKKFSYIDLIFFVLIVELVSFSLLTAVTLSGEANLLSKRTIYAEKILESELEKIENEIKVKIISSPFSVNKEFDDGKYKLIINVMSLNEYTDKISIQIEYELISVKSGSGYKVKKIEKVVSHE